MTEQKRPWWEAVVAAAACMVPFLTDLVIKVFVYPRPFWVFYYDPEGIYYFGGYRLLAGGHPWNADNPGAPTYALSAAVIALFGFEIPDVDQFRIAAYLLGACTTAIAIWGIMRTLLNGVPLPLKIGAGFIYFCAPYSLQCNAVWSPETFYTTAAGLTLVALYQSAERGVGLKWWVGLGLALGFACGLKFTMLAWAVAGVTAPMALTDRPLRSRVGMSVAVGVGLVFGFIAVTILIIPEYSYMFGWLSRLATRSGSYGGGSASSISISRVWANELEAALSAKGFYLLIAISAIMSAVRIVRSSSRSADRVLFVFATIGFALTHVLIARQMTLRYLLPAGASGLVFVALAARLWLTTSPRIVQWGVCLFVAVMISRHVLADTAYHRLRVDNNLALHADIQQAIRKATGDKPNAVVVYAFQCPQPSLALRIETFNQSDQRVIDSMYPFEGYVGWDNEIHLPEGVNQWDIIVIRDQELVRLNASVGMKLGHVGEYCLYGPPR